MCSISLTNISLILTLSPPLPFSSLPLQDGSREIFYKGFMSLPQLGRNRTFCAQAHREEIASGSCSCVSRVVSAQGASIAVVYAEEVEAPNRIVDP